MPVHFFLRPVKRLLALCALVLLSITLLSACIGAPVESGGVGGAAAGVFSEVLATATTQQTPPSPTVLPEPTATTLSPTPVPTATPEPGKPLLGRRIGLDPGHGPRRDLGAVLVDPDTKKLILAEDELNLDVSLRMRDILAARGAEVVLTRESREQFSVPWPPDTNGDGVEEGQADDLQHRIDILNAANVEVFLSIHANSSSNPAKRKGAQALYCATDDCAFPAENKRLGKLTLDYLESRLAEVGYPLQNRELRSDYWEDCPGCPKSHLFLLGPAGGPRHPRAMAMPGIIIEAMYITSPEEAAQLLQDRVRDVIALAYSDALTEYFTVQP
jgi:N-acetylmuramoyl-L-alanine amidase